MATEYTAPLNPTRRIIGGERFSVTLERDVPLFGMSRIDTLREAWEKVGESTYFYVISPSLETVTAGKRDVGTLGVRVRVDAATRFAASVETAFIELGRHLGFMRVRQVTALDLKDATDVAKLAEKTAEEEKEGAGKNVIERAADVAKDAGAAARNALGAGFDVVKLVAVAGAIIGAAFLLRELRGLKA